MPQKSLFIGIENEPINPHIFTNQVVLNCPILTRGNWPILIMLLGQKGFLYCMYLPDHPRIDQQHACRDVTQHFIYLWSIQQKSSTTTLWYMYGVHMYTVGWVAATALLLSTDHLASCTRYWERKRGGRKGKRFANVFFFSSHGHIVPFCSNFHASRESSDGFGH